MPDNTSKTELAQPFEKRLWYRSPITAAVIIGLCNFAAPGLWDAMNSLGAGGQQTPWLVNSANALTFALMVLTSFLGSAITDLVGVNWALFLGGVGYVPYLAGLYCNSVFGTKWVILFGATTCGLSAGLFWAIEASIAFSYPEPERMGLFLGIWMSFRVLGQIVGGAINLGMNVDRDTEGSINPKVYLVFVGLQAAGPFLSFLMPKPHWVQRRDGQPVRLYTNIPILHELRETTRVLFSKNFLLLIPLIIAGIFPESFIFTYMASHFTVRVRALGSFLGAIACVIVANIVGTYLDIRRISDKTKARVTFGALIALMGGWWIWTIVLENNFPNGGEAIDWKSPYFGRTFALYILLMSTYQCFYLYVYFVSRQMAQTHADAVRIAGLVRMVQSAAQAVSYGTNSIESFALLGSAALNFGLWGLAIPFTIILIRKVGITLNGPPADRGDDEEDHVSSAPTLARSDSKEQRWDDSK